MQVAEHDAIFMVHNWQCFNDSASKMVDEATEHAEKSSSERLNEGGNESSTFHFGKSKLFFFIFLVCAGFEPYALIRST